MRARGEPGHEPARLRGDNQKLEPAQPSSSKQSVERGPGALLQRLEPAQNLPL
jgi:hypothetical protein